MNYKEAQDLTSRIRELPCVGNPLAVYDGAQTGQLFGDTKLEPGDQDPAQIVCRYPYNAGQACIFSGGHYCPSNFLGNIESNTLS